MAKKILIIIVIVLAVAIVGLFIWALSISRQSGGEVTVGESFRGFFPFTDDDGSGLFTLRSDEGVARPLFNGDDQGDGAVTSRLRQISSFPVAGVVAVEDEQGRTFLRFIARENGHVFETEQDSFTQKRIANTTILRIQDAHWLSGGSALIARYLNEENTQIESFYAELEETEDDTEGSLVGSFLPRGIFALDLSSDGEKMFYLTESRDGSVGILADPDGGKKVQVFDSPFSEWIAQWPGENTIALTTKSSSDIKGYLYFLNIKTEKFEKIIGGVRGLTTLVHPDGKQVLFTQNTGRLLLSVFNTDTDETKELPLWTLAEKCVWSKKKENIVYCGVPGSIPQGEQLDLWYQGFVSFSDGIWSIDTEAETTNLLASPVEITGKSIDIIKPILTPDEKHLIFTDKNDSTLWTLKLEE